MLAYCLVDIGNLLITAIQVRWLAINSLSIVASSVL